ncbi:MAG TPA: SDR family NAD(P)-dependent oxidoreductase [Flavobacteriaceae bacterium]|nr:SDR family NAD(P)-dependent oxidoreductase [Flavobacteriaceae bacterium]
MKNLASSIAIVTGAGRGLGAAIAKKLAEEGARVYGMARNENELTQLANTTKGELIPVVLDLTMRNEIANWVQSEFVSSFPNILINNAGAGVFAKIDEMQEDQWDQMIGVNLTGVFNITAPVVSKMRKNNQGYIINIGSILGTTTRAEGAAYSATKYGIRGFSESLMKELRGDNIKVSCINPGSIDTDFFQSSGIRKHANMLQPEDLAEVILFLLKTPNNMLIDELTVRPLDSRNPDKL